MDDFHLCVFQLVLSSALDLLHAREAMTKSQLFDCSTRHPSLSFVANIPLTISKLCQTSALRVDQTEAARLLCPGCVILFPAVAQASRLEIEYSRRTERRDRQKKGAAWPVFSGLSVSASGHALVQASRYT